MLMLCPEVQRHVLGTVQREKSRPEVFGIDTNLKQDRTKGKETMMVAVIRNRVYAD